MLRLLACSIGITPEPAATRVALVHDFLLDLRGAERVFAELCRMWPQADIYTAVYDEEGTEGRFADRVVHSSFLQRLRPTARTFRTLLPLYPSAIESFDLSGYDLVVSSSSAWAHAVLCDAHTVHVSYCHNPFRYVWNDRDGTLARVRNPLARGLLRAAFRRWRQWDWIAAQRTNRYVANSRTTQARIRAYFGRDAEVVYPPVETGALRPRDRRRLLPARLRADAPQADRHRGGRLHPAALPLVVVGDGPDGRRLRRRAGPSVSFAGRVADAEVATLMAGARAMVVTSVEEFGIAAVESQAAGRPVIAKRGGGALETVVDGVTGCFWSGGPEELASVVLRFEDACGGPRGLRRQCPAL